MRRGIIIVLAAALAAAAYAGVGSVISSFYIGKAAEPNNKFRAIYRDPSYVYVLFWDSDKISVLTYTPSGGLVLTKEVATNHFHDYLGSATGTHLGSPYIAFSATEGFIPWKIYIAHTSTGSVAGSFSVQGPGSTEGTDIMWDGVYYNVHSGKGAYKRYTTAGSAAGDWAVAGWPAGLEANASTFSPRFNGATGRYLFVVSYSYRSNFAFDMNDGSLLASWRHGLPNRCYGQSYGDAYPTSSGGALWYHGYLYEGSAHWAYQIDVDSSGVSVLPASLGKIKVVYR